MKRILMSTAAICFCMIGFAQEKPTVEVVKFTAPVIVKDSKPTTAKKVSYSKRKNRKKNQAVKFTPPVIVKDTEVKQ